MTKVDKIQRKMNEDFRGLLASKINEKFGIKVETEWSLFTMRLMTTKKDGTKFTRKQLDFIGAYSVGYSDAMNLVK